MTKSELIKALESYPDDMEVFVSERKTEFTYGLVNSVYSKEIFINLRDEYDIYDNGHNDTVIILDEE